MSIVAEYGTGTGVIVSHNRQFVILAPWKSASSTIRARLGRYGDSPYSAFYELNPHLQRVVHQHLTYADFVALPESRLGYFTAAFVRNPYDRVFSGFRQIQKDLQQQPRMEFPDDAVRRLVLSQLSENFEQLSEAGFDFERWLDLVREEQVIETGRNTSLPLHPAHYWTHHDGEQAVDFVGRVETFEADFARLCATLGIERGDRINENVDANAEELGGDRHGYRYAARMSAHARRRISDLFDDDFELFGYTRID